MSLLQTIKNDALEARKARKSQTASSLTTLIGELETQAKNVGHEPSDADVVAAIKKTVKNIDETIKALRQDDDRQVSLNHEKLLFELYLPKQLSEPELKEAIEACILAGATNVGAVMKLLKEQYSGQYDGALASSILKIRFAK